MHKLLSRRPSDWTQRTLRWLLVHPMALLLVSMPVPPHIEADVELTNVDRGS